MPRSKSIVSAYASLEKLPITVWDARERRSNCDVENTMDGIFNRLPGKKHVKIQNNQLVEQIILAFLYFMLPGAAAQTRQARKRRIMRAKLIPSAASADGVR